MKKFLDFFFFIFADVGKLNKKADNCKNAEYMPGEQIYGKKNFINKGIYKFKNSEVGKFDFTVCENKKVYYKVKAYNSETYVREKLLFFTEHKFQSFQFLFGLVWRLHNINSFLCFHYITKLKIKLKKTEKSPATICCEAVFMPFFI